jgi:hypothetical protein
MPRVALAVFAVALCAAAPARAQVPRTADGRPDLQGIWQAFSTAAWDLEDHIAREGVPAGVSVVVGGRIPYLPAADAKRRENFANRLTADPEAKCYLPGVPRITYMPFPFQIFQTSTQVTFAYEYLHALRQVHTNGTAHPKGVEFWMGDSRGTWEGDTLVVDVTNFTDGTWLDRAGNFHSSALHVVERYRMVGPDHIEYDATLEDPAVFSRPWTIRLLLYRRKEPNFQLLEYECVEFLEQRSRS